MLRFGKQKAVIRKTLIQMSLCTSPSPKAIATCSMPKNMEKLVRGRWRLEPRFLVSWSCGSSDTFSESSRDLHSELCCLSFRARSHTLCFEGNSHLKKKMPFWGVLGRLQHSHSHGSFFERGNHTLRWACGWQLNFKSVTADCPKVLLSTTPTMVVVP